MNYGVYNTLGYTLAFVFFIALAIPIFTNQYLDMKNAVTTSFIFFTWMSVSIAISKFFVLKPDSILSLKKQGITGGAARTCN